MNRRRDLRSPVNGHVKVSGSVGEVHGTIENLSRSGLLLTAADLSRMGEENDLVAHLVLRGRAPVSVPVRSVRREVRGTDVHWALAFDEECAGAIGVIDEEIDAMVMAAARRPVLVIDNVAERRAQLTRALADAGMTPLAPRTPLDAIELLSRAQVYIPVALIAGQIGNVSVAELENFLSETFPWIAQIEIGTEPLTDSVARAAAAWAVAQRRMNATAGELEI